MKCYQIYLIFTTANLKRWPAPATKSFGTAPVYFTAIATILGAILFLRFGFAVGTLGFWGVIGVILLGHLVTIPTALAISEIATNKRVEGGGEYFIISRSFGLNIGATIGFALFISQAISVAFYIIAFTEAFEFFFNWVSTRFDLYLAQAGDQHSGHDRAFGPDPEKRSFGGHENPLYRGGHPACFPGALLSGKHGIQCRHNTFSLTSAEKGDMSQFFMVFAIIFPAFTGMTAGVGLSGDLKKPSKSIPTGNHSGHRDRDDCLFFHCLQTGHFGQPGNPRRSGQPAGYGRYRHCRGLYHPPGTGSIHLLFGHRLHPGGTAHPAGPGRGPILSFQETVQSIPVKRAGERPMNPINATLVTVVIAMVFVIIGDVNKVAGIISMFFMVTYGSLCLISFLHHFGSAPSYRPSFRSRWYISLVGFVASIWVMFKINTAFALAAIMIMVLLYLYINNYHKNRKGLVSIFTNALFQLNRSLQVYLQQTRKSQRQQGMETQCHLYLQGFFQTG